MPTVRVISREKAQQTRTPKTSSDRLARMNQFDEYAQALVDNPDKAVVYADLGEEPSTFVMSLRKAFRRVGMHAVVRKTPRRDDVRAWHAQPSTQGTAATRSRTVTKAKTTRRPRPPKGAFTREDPLFRLIGIGEGKTAGGVSGKKHEALARAYRPH